MVFDYRDERVLVQEFSSDWPIMQHLISLFVWPWLVVNYRKFSDEIVFFSHTNQSAVLLHEPATIRTNQPNRLIRSGDVWLFPSVSAYIWYNIYCKLDRTRHADQCPAKQNYYHYSKHTNLFLFSPALLTPSLTGPKGFSSFSRVLL